MKVGCTVLADARMNERTGLLRISECPEVLSEDSPGGERWKGEFLLRELAESYPRMRGTRMLEWDSALAREPEPLVVKPVIDTDNPEIANMLGNHVDNPFHDPEKSAIIAVLCAEFRHGVRRGS
jgi:hypothetical protein